MIDFPAVRPGQDIDISATSFVTFLRCPEYAGARYRGEYGPESRSGFSGQLAHRIFARHLSAGPIAEGGFEQACREEIGVGMNVKVSALGLKPSELGRVIGEVGELYARFKAMDFEGCLGTEATIEVIPVDGVTLKGSIDAVFDDAEAGVRLVDWKTGGVAATSDQLSFYALLWALEHGELPGRVESVSVRTGERFQEVPSLTDVESTAGRVATMVDTMRAAWESDDPLERRGGPWCRFCPLLDECAEGRAAVVVTAEG